MDTIFAWFPHSLRRYTQFGGRASRPEYWWFWAITVVVGLVLHFLRQYLPGVGLLISTVWGLGIFLPSLAVASRRLHDSGHSFWWVAPSWIAAGLLIGFLAAFRANIRFPAFLFLGVLLILFSTVGGLVYLLCRPGDTGPNRYGDIAPTTPV